MAYSANNRSHHVVIVGGGFGGLYAAKALKRAPVKVTLIDKRNFHLFQPLLYQVATGGLSPGDIASPLRAVFSRQKNTTVLNAEVVDLDPAGQRVILRNGELSYDTLIVASGSSHHYFGHDEWSTMAPGLKTVEDALDIRRRILMAFEAAERETDPDRRRAWMTFVVVGGGPTGVELAGAIGELARTTLKDDFRHIDPAQAQILPLEGTDRVLPVYSPDLSAKAEASLARLGVAVRTGCLVTDIQDDVVTVSRGDRVELIQARTLLWAAGMKASPMGLVLAQRTGVELDRAGRVMVEPDLSIARNPHIFVIGDLAHVAHQDGAPLPGVAPVAMQQGRYVADLIQAQLSQGTSTSQPGGATERELELHPYRASDRPFRASDRPFRASDRPFRASDRPYRASDRPYRASDRPFRYRDRGNLAVIGRNASVAELGSLKFAGFPAWNYFTRNRGARLITGDDPFPLVEDASRDRLQTFTVMPVRTNAEVEG
jgi:NADH dehydrogenase